MVCNETTKYDFILPSKQGRTQLIFSLMEPKRLYLGVVPNNWTCFWKFRVEQLPGS